MSADWKENNNLEKKYPQKVAELKELLMQCIDNGRSTPGPVPENDGAFIPATVKWMHK